MGGDLVPHCRVREQPQTLLEAHEPPSFPGPTSEELESAFGRDATRDWVFTSPKWGPTAKASGELNMCIVC